MIKQLFYSGPSFEVLREEYAKKGHIDDQAPIQSSGEITIHAPIERGWDLLIDLPQWSTFDPTYHNIRFGTAANIDAHFSFRVNNFPIHAKNIDHRSGSYAYLDRCFSMVQVHRPSCSGGDTRLRYTPAHLRFSVWHPAFTIHEQCKIEGSA